MNTPDALDRSRGLRVTGLRSALAGPFDLAVAPGEIAVVSGASGSGKCLLLRMVADLDPNEGMVTLDGLSRGDIPADEWRRRVPYVAAEPGWWAETGLGHFDGVHRGQAVALAERLGISTIRLNGPVSSLSTGERQRLALVRGLVLDPPALLLDEPTGPLDATATDRVDTLLRERSATGGVTIVASHDRGQAGRLGATCLWMADRVLATAS